MTTNNDHPLLQTGRQANPEQPAKRPSTSPAITEDRVREIVREELRAKEIAGKVKPLVAKATREAKAGTKHGR